MQSGGSHRRTSPRVVWECFDGEWKQMPNYMQGRVELEYQDRRNNGMVYFVLPRREPETYVHVHLVDVNKMRQLSFLGSTMVACMAIRRIAI